ncbi:hypothetical protein HY492_03460 [Candidatus Woesearchaeota archaeon]|nr:hypothetical protein [Candidatus Woesearchaeota archaeon]
MQTMLQDTVTSFDAFTQRLRDQYNSDGDPALDEDIVRFLGEHPDPGKSSFAGRMTPEFFKVLTKAAVRLANYHGNDARHILWAARCYCRAGENQIAPGDDAKKMALAFLRSQEAFFEAQLGDRMVNSRDAVHHYLRSFWCYTHAIRIAGAASNPLTYLASQYRFRGDIAQELSERLDEPNWSWRAAEDAELSAGANAILPNRSHPLATASFRYYQASTKIPEVREALLTRSFDLGIESQHSLKQLDQNRWAHLCGNIGRVAAELSTFGKAEYQELARKYLTLALNGLEKNPHAEKARYAIQRTLSSLPNV